MWITLTHKKCESGDSTSHPTHNYVDLVTVVAIHVNYCGPSCTIEICENEFSQKKIKIFLNYYILTISQFFFIFLIKILLHIFYQ
jgi:hypothetical protein